MGRSNIQTIEKSAEEIKHEKCFNIDQCISDEHSQLKAVNSTYKRSVRSKYKKTLEQSLDNLLLLSKHYNCNQ